MFFWAFFSWLSSWRGQLYSPAGHCYSTWSVLWLWYNCPGPATSFFCVKALTKLQRQALGCEENELFLSNLFQEQHYTSDVATQTHKSCPCSFLLSFMWTEESDLSFLFLQDPQHFHFTCAAEMQWINLGNNHIIHLHPVPSWKWETRVLRGGNKGKIFFSTPAEFMLPEESIYV